MFRQERAGSNPVTGIMITYKETKYDGYRVGDDGSIWTKWVFKGSGKSYKTWKVDYWIKLEPSHYRKGYPRVYIFKKAICIHTLIAETFLGPCPVGLECRHLDGVKTNCKLSNLLWGTHYENMQDMVRHQTSTIGENNPNSILTKELAVEIREKYSTSKYTLMQLSEMYPISYVNIHYIVTNQIWKD